MKIAISAGEVSGDQHAANVARALKQRLPRAEFRGMGGRFLRDEGVKTVVDSESSASVMGFTEVVANLTEILKSLSTMKTLLRSWRPDLLIVCDYQDFHFRLIRTAKSLNIPVLFFISPSVWAWRTGRIKLVERYVDQMAVIFPFERPFYEQHGCQKTVYVGHPLAEKALLDTAAKSALLSNLPVEGTRPVALLLPGSRRKEVSMNLAPMLEGFALVQRKHPEVQGLLSVAPGIDSKELEHEASKVEGLYVSSHPAFELMQISSAGLLKSGTSNLQAARCDMPFSMLYQGTLLTEFISLVAIKVKQYSIVNIIRPNTVREIIQREVTAQNLAQELERLLFETEYREGVISGIQSVAASLDEADPHPAFTECRTVPERVAALAEELLST